VAAPFSNGGPPVTDQQRYELMSSGEGVDTDQCRAFHAAE
jgi:hypothetical protein